MAVELGGSCGAAGGMGRGWAPAARHQCAVLAKSVCQEASNCLPQALHSPPRHRRLASDAAQLAPRLAQAERLARLEVELAAREAECRVKVNGCGEAVVPASCHNKLIVWGALQGSVLSTATCLSTARPLSPQAEQLAAGQAALDAGAARFEAAQERLEGERARLFDAQAAVAAEQQAMAAFR